RQSPPSGLIARIPKVGRVLGDVLFDPDDTLVDHANELGQSAKDLIVRDVGCEPGTFENQRDPPQELRKIRVGERWRIVVSIKAAQVSIHYSPSYRLIRRCAVDKQVQKVRSQQLTQDATYSDRSLALRIGIALFGGREREEPGHPPFKGVRGRYG